MPITGVPTEDLQEKGSKEDGSGAQLSFAARKVLNDKSPRPFPCTFEGCPWSFARQSDQRRHLRSHQRPMFHCPYWRSDPTCHRNGGSFNRQDVLKRHLKLVHFVQFKQSESGWCRVCQKMFPNPKHFVAHCEKCAEEAQPTEWRINNDKSSETGGPASETSGPVEEGSSKKQAGGPTTRQPRRDQSNSKTVSQQHPPPAPSDPSGASGSHSDLVMKAYIPKPKVTRTRVRKQHDAVAAAREAEASAAAIASAGVKGSTSTLSAFTMKETMKSAAFRRSSLLGEGIENAEEKEGGQQVDSEVRRREEEEEEEDEEEAYQTANEDSDGVEERQQQSRPPPPMASTEQELLLAHMQDEQEMDDVNVVTSTRVVNSGPGPMTQPLYKGVRKAEGSGDGGRVKRLRRPQRTKKMDAASKESESKDEQEAEHDEEDHVQDEDHQEDEQDEEENDGGEEGKQEKRRGRPRRKKASGSESASTATSIGSKKGGVSKETKTRSTRNSSGASGGGGVVSYRTRGRGSGSNRQTLSNSIQAGHHLSK